MRHGQPPLEGGCVLHELQDTSLRSEWNNLVASDAKVSPFCLPVFIKNHVDQLEYLLHDSILT